MFSPTRTALYVAISAMALAANEANAGCKIISGSRVCASWIIGSEICQVTFDTEVSNVDPNDVSITCSITGVDENSCPSGELPPGDLTCGPGTIPPTEPLAPAPGSGNGWTIYGFAGVELTGGSTSNSAVGSNEKIALSGGKTKIFGNAFAGDMVSTKGGASVTQSTVNGAPPIAQVAYPACSPFSTGITPGAGGSYDATTGVLDLRGGGTVTLDSPGPYCFSAVMLSAGSTLAISGDTTIDMTGTITSSGGRFLTGGAALAINSSATTKFMFSGGSGDNMTLYAPFADITFSGGARFSASFIGNKVTATGGSAINSLDPAIILPYPGSTLSADATDVRCNNNGICTATAEIEPPPGSTCENGGEVLDFTADQFLGHVQACDGGEGGCVDLWQLCTRNGNKYDCVEVPDPDDNEACGGGS